MFQLITFNTNSILKRSNQHHHIAISTSAGHSLIRQHTWAIDVICRDLLTPRTIIGLTETHVESREQLLFFLGEV